MNKILLTLTTAVVLGTFSQRAGADLIELKNGRVLHGEILGGHTSDAGLAVKMFDTDGELLVRWDHILPERARELRIQYGIDLEEAETIPVDGHELTSITGEKIVGLLLNPDDTTGPYRLKTEKGVREYPRESIQGKPRPRELEISEVYTPREAYQIRLDESPPQDARANFDLGSYAFAVGDYDMAKKHFGIAQMDPEFAKSDDGRSLDQRIAQADILIAAHDAKEMVQRVKLAMARRDYNEARDLMVSLKTDVTDERILKAVRYDMLERKVVRDRDEYFTSKLQSQTYKVMRDMIRDKAKEKRKPSLTNEPKSGGAAYGTLAAARQWTSKDLPQLLWAKVADSLGLTLEEVTDYWGRRRLKQPQTATYGTGTFIVTKTELPKKRDGRRQPPGRSRDSGGGNRGPQPTKKEQQPLTDEGWWDQATNNDQVQWLTAFFAEGSGFFEVIRVDESENCQNCGGLGFTTVTSTGGGSESHFCSQCNGAGKFRKVIFR